MFNPYHEVHVELDEHGVFKDVENNLLNVPHNCIDTGSWVMFNCYCNCQSETAYVVDIAKRYNGKISAYESKPLI